MISMHGINSLSQSLKFIFLITLRIDRTYAAVQKTFMPIHAYPAFNVERAAAASADCAAPPPYKACWISAHAATTELRTIRPNEKRAEGVTLPPNHKTSPYAITMIVKFLKMVYTGTERN